MPTFRATLLAVVFNFCLTALHAGAQQAAAGSTRTGDPRLPVGTKLVDLSVRGFDKSDGLQSPTVYSVAVDLSGRLWIGTELGPMRYDGDRWQPEPLPAAVATRQTRGILQSSDSSYWFATRFGVVRKRGTTERLFVMTDGLPNAVVYSIIETRAISGTPQVVVGTGAGVAVFDGARFQPLALPDSLSPEGLMLGEAQARDGTLELWLASSRGKVARFAKGKWKVFGAADGLTSQSAEAIVVSHGDPSTRLLVPGDAGVFAFHDDGPRGERFELLPGSPRRAYRVAELARIDGARELWVGTLTGIVLRRTAAGWDTVDIALQQPGGRVTALQVVPGHAGGTAVYVGTYGGRLARVGVSGFGTLEMRGTRRDVMMAVLPEISTGGRTALWMGALKNGLLHLSATGELTEYSRETGQEFSLVTAIASLSSVKRSVTRGDSLTESRDLWVGTDDGPYRREGTQLTRRANGIGRRLVTAFMRGPLPDGTSSLLAATDGGLFRWSGSEWELVNAFGPNPIRAMTLVRTAGESALWLALHRGTAIATHSAITFDSDSSPVQTAASSAAEPRALSRATVTSLCGIGGLAVSERVFAGTTDDGLWWRSPNGAWQAVPVELKRAIGSRYIRSLSCPGDGRLLVGLAYGLAVLDVRDRDPSGWSVVSVASQEDGLPATETLTFAQQAVNGIVWIGTSRGLGALQLQRVNNTPVPRLTIELQSEGRSLATDTEVELHAGRSDLTIQPSLHTYHREDDTRYRVLLNRDGESNAALDAAADDSLAWTDAPEVRYRSLSAGQYTLRVLARDFAGRIVDLPAIHFRVTPPLWRRWWSILLYATFLVALIYATHRWRLHTLERTNEQLASSERQMRASERKFRALFDDAIDAHLLIDGPHVTAINAPGRMLLELDDDSTEALRGSAGLPDWRAVLPAAIVREVHELAVNGEVREYDIEMTGGTSIPVSAQITTVQLDDRSLWHLVMRDLRAAREAQQVRQRLEEQVRDAQKFESLGTLAGGVAHDFNNLLGVIQGNVELALDTLDDREAVATHLGTVYDASDRARDLVRQILTFSRRSSSRDEYVDLGRLTRELQPMLRSMIPTSIEIVIEGADQPLLVHGDSTQLQQILLNLSSNAEYAMRAQGGGQLFITLDACTDSSIDAPGGRAIRISVTDTGVGMSRAVLERVFEPFFTTKPTGEGTGLGMAVLHGIVASHGGRVHVSSIPGAGTTFEILLPAATDGPPLHAADSVKGVVRPAAIQWSGDALASVRAANSLIVLVDDEPTVAHVGETALTRMGYRVATFVDSRTALSFIASNASAIDLVITDQTMPGMTGDVLTMELRKLRPDLPVIITSGFSYVLTADRLAAIGAHTVLQKPVSLAALRVAVEAALSGRTYTSRA